MLRKMYKNEKVRVFSDTSLRLLKEFAIPFTLSAAWTYANLRTSPQIGFSIVLKTFGPAFFFVSWITGQIVRVRKQVKVEKGMEGIEGRLTHLVQDLENKTDNIIGYITGGDSFPYIQIGSINHLENVGMVMLLHTGTFPLYNVHIRLTDLDIFHALPTEQKVALAHKAETIFNIDHMVPNFAVGIGNWTAEAGDTQKNYNAFFTARNGGVTQLIRMRKIGGLWKTAIKVIRNGKIGPSAFSEILLEQVPDEFSREQDGTFKW